VHVCTHCIREKMRGPLFCDQQIFSGALAAAKKAPKFHSGLTWLLPRSSFHFAPCENDVSLAASILAQACPANLIAVTNDGDYDVSFFCTNAPGRAFTSLRIAMGYQKCIATRYHSNKNYLEIFMTHTANKKEQLKAVSKQRAEAIAQAKQLAKECAATPQNEVFF